MQWHTTRKFNRDRALARLRRLLADPATPQNTITIIKDKCLTGGDAVLGRSEPYPYAIIGKSLDMSGRGGVLIADLSEAVELSGKIELEPTESIRFELETGQVVVPSQDNPPGFRFNPDHKAGFAKCDSQSATLADRELVVSRMPAENVSGRIDELTRCFRATPVTFQKSDIVIIGDKADFLTVRLRGDTKSCLCREFTDFRLIEVADGEQDSIEYLAIDSRQDIRLVF